MVPNKPFYSSVIAIILMPVGVLSTLGVLMISVSGARTWDQYGIDNILHMSGGISIALSTAGIVWHGIRREVIQLTSVLVVRVLVFGCVCLAIIIWEILEFIIVFPIWPELVSYSDTVIDMIYGLIGGLLGVSCIGISILQQNYERS
jgi:hypothetical protein